jgi:hypothetical protein
VHLAGKNIAARSGVFALASNCILVIEDLGDKESYLLDKTDSKRRVQGLTVS